MGWILEHIGKSSLVFTAIEGEQRFAHDYAIELSDLSLVSYFIWTPKRFIWIAKHSGKYVGKVALEIF